MQPVALRTKIKRASDAQAATFHKRRGSDEASYARRNLTAAVA